MAAVMLGMLLLVLVALGCLGSSSPSHPQARVVGIVRIVGGPTDSIRAYEQGPVIIVGRTATKHGLRRRLTTDRRGHFEATLPPGQYLVVSKMFDLPLVDQPQRRVRVFADRPMRIKLTGYVQWPHLTRGGRPRLAVVPFDKGACIDRARPPKGRPLGLRLWCASTSAAQWERTYAASASRSHSAPKANQM
jgi:hypothetical protein